MSRPPGFDTEFVYELCVCRWAELAWPPTDDASVESDAANVATGSAFDSNAAGADEEPRASRPTHLVARQIGTKRRRWDTIVLEVDPAGLRQRAAFGESELDSDLLHVVRNAPAEWAWYRDVLPEPDYPWRYVREAIHRAADRDTLHTRRSGNRIEIKRIAPYPDWLDSLIAIENKPDLDSSAARRLGEQLAHDVSVGLADSVWVATERTGRTVEPALLEALPVEAGILTTDFDDGVDRDSAAVAWHPTGLTQTHDAATRERRRLELAERAYGRGWRSYHETMRPDCRFFGLRRHGRALLPWCDAKGCHQSAAVCAGSCEQFEPEPPAWRTRGWPIEGGPGAGLRRLLTDRADRER